MQVNPVGLAKPAWLVMMVSSVDFAKPTGLKFTLSFVNVLLMSFILMVT